MRVSAKFEKTLVLRGCMNGPSHSGLSAVLAPIFSFSSSACLRWSRLIDQEAVDERLARRALGQELGHLGLQKGLGECDRVACGKGRGLSSAGTPRVAVLPASSRAVTASGVPWTKS